MDLQQLRASTQQEHQAVEGIMPVMDPGLTLGQYQQTLRGLYGILSAWDSWAETHAPAALKTETASRRRSPLLEQDLRYLGDTAKPVPVELELPADKYGFLGAMYVIEGSTLGGQHIARHVEQTLGFHVGAGNSYFVGYGEQTSARWRQFQDILRAVPEHHTDEVVTGARAMFTQFRLWMMKALQSSKAEDGKEQAAQTAGHGR